MEQSLFDNIERLPYLLLVSLVFFGLGYVIGTYTGLKINKYFEKGNKQAKIDQLEFLRFFIAVIITLAWAGSVFVEMLDRTYTTNVQLHAIMGLLVGSVQNINITNIFKSLKNDKSTDK